LTDDKVRIVAPTHAAVVARKRAGHVIALVLQIEAQDGAAHVNIVLDVGEFVAAHPEALRPEGHHLHETDGAGGGDGVAIEGALHRHQAHDQAGGQPRFTRPVRLAVDDSEHVHALRLARHELAQLGLHHLVPDRRVVAVGETLRLTNRALDDSAEFRIALLIRLRRGAAEEAGSKGCVSGAGASE